jgi:dTDP-4-amino-4,6-dideoxygalactose transaminase
MTFRIKITEPLLPDTSQLLSLLKDIIESGNITNNGNVLQKFEQALAVSQNSANCSLVCNATVGLMIALRAIGAENKVITTPFSFAATSGVLEFLDVEPVFCDISENSPNIDIKGVSKVFAKDVSAVLPVHCYGIACDVVAFEEFCKTERIKLVYDAAHCISRTVNSKSIFDYGDASVVSLHATKILTSVEGGAIFAADTETNERVRMMRNFGISSVDRISDLGINGKMSEFHAAVGLLNLQILEAALCQRKLIAKHYYKNLNSKLSHVIVENTSNNFGYFPVRFSSRKIRDDVYNSLYHNGILSRKYFSPLLSSRYNINSKSSFPNAYSFVNTVLCLPIHANLSLSEVDEIIDIVNSSLDDHF